jgi:hypothetical protein
MSTALPAAPATEKRDRRRRGVVVLKFSLAGAALLGIAAAATSAAWSDNAWFSGTATGATVNLEGAVTAVGGTPAVGDWTHADGTGTTPSITVDSAAFGVDNLLPGDDKKIQLNLRNAGSTALTLGTTTVALDGASDFITTDSTDAIHNAVLTVTSIPGSLAKEATTSVTLELKVGSEWPQTNAAKSGKFTVSFPGTATH